MIVQKVLLTAVALSFFISAGVSKILACGMNLSLPVNHFNGVNGKGFVSYWEKIGDLDLGAGLQIPISIGFSSANNASSPYLGKGWTLALLESHLVQIDSKFFLMRLPTGFNIRLHLENATDNMLTGGAGTWMGQLGDHTATLWADCGWKLVFTDGKITSMITPDNKVLTYIYEGNVVKEIDEDGVPKLRVLVDPQTGKVDGINFNDRSITLQEGDRPCIENIKGQNVIGMFEPSLQEMKLSDGKVENFKFGTDENLQPTLNITGARTRSFVWDSATGLILSSGIWTYKIVPSDNHTWYSNAQITRTNRAGRTEYWYFDALHGKVTSQGMDGIRKITTSFVENGLSDLSGKVRSVMHIKDGVSSVTDQYFYDENGRILRKIAFDPITQEKEETDFTYLPDDGIRILIKTAELSTVRTYDKDGNFTEQQVDSATVK